MYLPINLIDFLLKKFFEMLRNSFILIILASHLKPTNIFRKTNKGSKITKGYVFNLTETCNDTLGGERGFNLITDIQVKATSFEL